MNTNTLLAGVIIITSLAFSSCVKDGPIGPQGPAGANGNANVTSQLYSVTSWSNNGTTYYANLPDNYLTPAIQNYGTAQVFFSVDAGTTWEALPYTYVATVNYNMSFTTTVGNVQIDWDYNSNTLGSDPNTVFGATCQFKVICISADGVNAHPNVNYNNYLDVKKAFNLKD